MEQNHLKQTCREFFHQEILFLLEGLTAPVSSCSDKIMTLSRASYSRVSKQQGLSYRNVNACTFTMTQFWVISFLGYF